MPVTGGVGADPRDRVRGDVHGLRRVTVRRQPQREAAVVAEAVEQTPARVARRGLAVFALVQEEPGLLAGPQIHFVLHRAFAHHDGVRHRTGQLLDVLIQALQEAHLGIVAGQDASRCQRFLQRGDHVGYQRVHPLRQRLHHQIVPVAIHDQRGQQIGFTVHQAIGGGVNRQTLAELHGALEARLQ